MITREKLDFMHGRRGETRPKARRLGNTPKSLLNANIRTKLVFKRCINRLWNEPERVVKTKPEKTEPGRN